MIYDLTVMGTSHFPPDIQQKLFYQQHFCMKNIKMYPSGMAWPGTVYYSL